MKRRKFIKSTGIAGGMVVIAPAIANSYFSAPVDFPVIDMHVHMSRNFTIDKIMEIAGRTGIRFGIVENPGANVRDDATLSEYINKLRPYPVYIGLQPMSPGWSEDFSPETIAQLDYVLMDPQTVPRGNKYGETLTIWNYDTYVDDAESFMEVYVAHSLEVLNNNEPIHVFGWPLFLPVCIARDYYSLWTEERMQKIIEAAKKRNIAFEINDIAHTPHEKFINMAKEQGLKFTFGSDTRNNKAGRLDYCKYIAGKCNLKGEDFFVPPRIPGKA
jgi:histidinol phosphatase-like PHP family hydrolase